jgi:DNA-binding MarR family transcriptional regulator
MVAAPKDQVDKILAQWRRERPDIDTSSMGVIGRIPRISRRFDRELRREFRKHDLADWEFDLLAALRRSGSPFEMSPTALVGALMITSGAVTNRSDRLAARGLVYRKADATDRRANFVGLTAEGLRLVDETLAAHVANEERMLAALNKAERAALEPLLRKLLTSLEHADGSSS